MEKKSNKVLVYCRVSSDRQKKEGNGLDSQEQRCREYSRVHAYEVISVFKDSYTGGGDFNKRPGLSDMLSFINANPDQNFIVLIDDLSRFARDVSAHFKLKKELFDKGITLECTNFNFEDTPEGELIETMMAAQHQYHRKNNRRQVLQKMKARLEGGYWTFNSSVPGYERSNRSQNWILIRKEPEASIIQEALEGFASGRFIDQKDVKEFLERKDFNKGKNIHLSQVGRLLTRVLYAGHIEYKKWNVSLREGKHEAIISLDTYNKIQDKLLGKQKVRTRKDYNKDFPLRGYVRCTECNVKFTASWTTGRSDRYPYYRCQGKECKYRNKKVDRSKLEGDFKKLLKSIVPNQKVLNLTKAIVKDLYDKKHKEHRGELSNHKKEITRIDKEINVFMERITKTESPVMLDKYETRITELEDKKREIEAFLSDNNDFKVGFGTAVNEVFDILKNPVNIWVNGGLKEKKLVMNLVFNQDLIYDKEYGFGTAEMSSVIKVFGQFRDQKLHDVEMPEIESGSREKF